jgi:predicted nucleic acid-binding protein
MVTESWIANASPLILLGKAGLLDLLPRLVKEILVPQAVMREILMRADETEIIDALAPGGSFRVEQDIEVPLAIQGWDLGAGETQVIAAGVSKRDSRVILDDREARRCARVMGLRIIGTVGLVARAKRLGLLDEARSHIERLRATGLYLTDDLVEQVLMAVGE